MKTVMSQDGILFIRAGRLGLGDGLTPVCIGILVWGEPVIAVISLRLLMGEKGHLKSGWI